MLSLSQTGYSGLINVLSLHGVDPNILRRRYIDRVRGIGPCRAV